MDLELKFDKESDVCRVYIVGVVNIDKILAQLPGFLAHEDFVPGMAVIFDLREASMAETSVNQMQKAGAEHRLVADRRGMAKVAAVAASDLDFGILRMYEVHAQSPNIEFCVFREMEEAEKWARGHMPTIAI
jgi:hypothetical protein